MQIVRFYANLPIHKHQLNLSLTVICQCISQIEIILKFKLFSVQSPTFKYILEKRRYQKQQIYSFGTSWFIFRSKYKETMGTNTGLSSREKSYQNNDVNILTVHFDFSDEHITHEYIMIGS